MRVAAELDALGLHGAARAFEVCGQTVAAPCGACGEQYAAAELHATCGLRACPYCARRNSRARGERVTRAVHRVPALTEAARPEVLSRLKREHDEAARAVWFHAARWSRAVERARETDHPEAHELAARHEARAVAAEARRVALAWHAKRAAAKGWGWRLVTLSPQWRPADPRELTPKGLARRIADVFDRWSKVWADLSCGGLASAFVSIECSEKGHVHLHALVYSPFASKGFLRTRAGCFVDVRAVDGNAAVREAVKYTVKSVSPLSHRWIAGGKAHVIHPALAAAWIAATHHEQLGRVLGLVRGECDDDEAAQSPPGPPSSPPVCRCCKAPVLAAMYPVPRDVLARALGSEWAKVLSITRGPTGPAFVAAPVSAPVVARVTREARYAPAAQIRLVLETRV